MMIEVVTATVGDITKTEATTEDAGNVDKDVNSGEEKESVYGK